MKTSKIIINFTLLCSAIFIAYLMYESIMTPIRFEEKRLEREVAVIQKLKDIRTAQEEYSREYARQHPGESGKYCDNLDSLVYFLQNTPMLVVPDKLENWNQEKHQQIKGLYNNDKLAAQIYNDAKRRALAEHTFAHDSLMHQYIWENDPEVISNFLQGFAYDTVSLVMIDELYYDKDLKRARYNNETIKDMIIIPYTDGMKFELATKDTIISDFAVSLFEARAPYNTYLSDQDKQEVINLSDLKEQMKKYPGLKVGDVNKSNNNAGNWETL